MSGIVPRSFKSTRVVPLIKKRKLNQNTLMNYRPVSPLSFMSKLLERCCIQQTKGYFSSNDLYVSAQSGYRSHYSTETALLQVQNDALGAMDDHREAALILLDFSSAFHTIDHAILLDRLKHRYSLTGTALQWFILIISY